MRANIVNMMRKMSSGDLGKLLLKDMIMGMANGSKAYTTEDFETVINRMDRSDKREYSKYVDIAGYILHHTAMCWWVGSAIEAATLRFDVILWIMRFCQTYEIASRCLTFQRLSYETSGGEWRDPGEEEILLRDLSKEMLESFLENREGIAEMRDMLMRFVKFHLTLDSIMKSLAELLDIPELGSIVKSPLHHVEELRQGIEKELATLPEDSPYRELLPEVDISSLEPDESEVESYVSFISKFLKA